MIFSFISTKVWNTDNLQQVDYFQISPNPSCLRFVNTVSSAKQCSTSLHCTNTNSLSLVINTQLHPNNPRNKAGEGPGWQV